jgi:hypothetical protein
VHLLRDVEARTLRLDHRNDALEMSFSALEAPDDGGVGGMSIQSGHPHMLSPWMGYINGHLIAIESLERFS